MSLEEEKDRERFKNVMDRFGYGNYEDTDPDAFFSNLGGDEMKESGWDQMLQRLDEEDKDWYKCSDCGWEGEVPVMNNGGEDPEKKDSMPPENANWCPECGEYPQDWDEIKEKLQEGEGIGTGEPGQDNPDDIEIGGSYSKDQYDQKWSEHSGKEKDKNKYWYTCSECGTNGKVDLREKLDKCPECESTALTYHFGGEARQKSIGLVTSLCETTNGEVGKDFILNEAKKRADSDKLFEEFSKILESIDEEEINKQLEFAAPEEKTTEKDASSVSRAYKPQSLKELNDLLEKFGSDYKLNENEYEKIMEMGNFVKEGEDEEESKFDMSECVNNLEEEKGLDEANTICEVASIAHTGTPAGLEEGEKTDKYCGNCGWDGIAKKDQCPNCGSRLRESLNISEDVKKQLQEYCTKDSCEQSDDTKGNWELRDHETGNQIACFDSKEACKRSASYGEGPLKEMDKDPADMQLEAAYTGDECPECGHDLPGECSYCPGCGCDLKESIQNMALEEGDGQCPECGHDLPGKCEYCPKCGCNLKEMRDTFGKVRVNEENIECSECGTKLYESSKYCHECGQTVEDTMNKKIEIFKEQWKKFFLENSSTERIKRFQYVLEDEGQDFLEQFKEELNQFGDWAEDNLDVEGYPYRTLSEEIEQAIQDHEEKAELQERIENLHSEVDSFL